MPPSHNTADELGEVGMRVEKVLAAGKDVICSNNKSWKGHVEICP